MFAASAFRKLSSIYVFSYFPFGFEGRIWDLIVSVPDHCLSFYLSKIKTPKKHYAVAEIKFAQFHQNNENCQLLQNLVDAFIQLKTFFFSTSPFPDSNKNNTLLFIEISLVRREREMPLQSLHSNAKPNRLFQICHSLVLYMDIGKLRPTYRVHGRSESCTEWCVNLKV